MTDASKYRQLLSNLPTASRRPFNLPHIARLPFGDFAMANAIFPDLIAPKYRSGGNSSADSSARDSAIVFSIAIQRCDDFQTIRRALCRDSQGRASGPLGHALDLILSGDRS
jgi:hypothetical protein